MTPCSSPSGPAQETPDKKYSHGSHGGNYSSVPQGIVILSFVHHSSTTLFYYCI